ncbi:MAG: HAD-IA family hydrolase [Planctomycetes bacterium]|nr:HAD-IA family hydrolase [Planctomycetota bacterium]
MTRECPDIMLFDLDGTLIDSVPDIAAAVNAMRSEFGMAAASVDQVRSWVGRGLSMLMHRALTDDAEGIAEVGQHEESIRIFRSHYQNCCTHQTVVFDGGRPLLEWLAASDIKVAIVTNKPVHFAKQIAESLEIGCHCDLIIGAESHRPLKPDPASIIEAVEQLGGGCAWMVGDTVFDRDAARAAGVPFVGVQLEGDQGRNISEITSKDEPVFDSLTSLHRWIESGFES